MVSVRNLFAAMMTAGVLFAGTVACTAQEPARSSDDTGDVVTGPDTSSDLEDYTLLESTWNTTAADVQANMCASFIEDEDMAVDLFFASAIASGVDPLPDETVVRVFFAAQC